MRWSFILNIVGMLILFLGICMIFPLFFGLYYKDHSVVPLASESSPFFRTKLTESCGNCHGDVTEDFAASAHAQAFDANVPGAPTCLKCHENDIVQGASDKDSVAVKVAQEKMCLACHLDDPEVRSRMSPTAGFIQAYDNSVHGAALAGGNARGRLRPGGRD